MAHPKNAVVSIPESYQNNKRHQISSITPNKRSRNDYETPKPVTSLEVETVILKPNQKVLITKEFRQSVPMKAIQQYAYSISSDVTDRITSSVKNLHQSLTGIDHEKFFPKHWITDQPKAISEAFIKVSTNPENDLEISFANLEVYEFLLLINYIISLDPFCNQSG